MPYYNTPIPFKSNANASVFNAPLTELDDTLYSILNGTFRWNAVDSPATTPRIGRRWLYAKAGGFYQKDSAGLETKLATSVDTASVGMQTLVPTQILSADASFIDITDIPQTATHLLVMVGLIDDKGGGAFDNQDFLQINSDNGANYDQNNLNIGSSITSEENLGGTSFLLWAVSTGATPNVAGDYAILISDYTDSSKPRQIAYLGHHLTGVPAQHVHIGGGTWQNSSDSITQLTFYPGTGASNILTKSYCTVYGLR